MTFESFAASRVRPLLRMATAISGDRHLAEDLVQDVLLKTQLRWAVISQADNPDAYLHRMLVNEFLSWRRKWSRILPRADLGPSDVVRDVAVNVTDREVMQARLHRLPRQQRVVLVLRYYAALTDNEIAAAMGCAPGTVRGYASRALTTLRAELATERTADEVTSP